MRSRMPHNKFTSAEKKCFPDIKFGSSGTKSVYFYIRNTVVSVIITETSPFFNEYTEFVKLVLLVATLAKKLSRRINVGKMSIVTSPTLQQYLTKYLTKTYDVLNFFPFVDHVSLIKRLHAFLERYGYINFGVYRYIETKRIVFKTISHQFHSNENFHSLYIFCLKLLCVDQLSLLERVYPV